MYLSNIKLWNFRKFGSNKVFDLGKPNLNLNLKNGLNVLVGQNDSGKTAIIDAIKLVLRTQSYEWIQISKDDFYDESLRFRIELQFGDLADDEAKHFTHWLGWTGKGTAAQPFLRLIYDVSRNSDRILPSDVTAGVDKEGSLLNAEAREYLKVTYLKPLRDATTELVPKKNSRLSQIFQEHEAFKGQDKNHDLTTLFDSFNKSVKNYFDGKDEKNKPLLDQKGKELKDRIDGYIQAFYDVTKTTGIVPAQGNLKSILEKLELLISDEINPGLGTLNRLFIASELLHLNKNNWNGLRLGLIEELEAHLHPQAQMQMIEALQKEKDIQLILTTHSPNLASKVNLENLIVCNNSMAFPMGNDFTELGKCNYVFLERFLDVTKANLFFAKGVIMVEGWAEEILIPSLARKMKKCGMIKKDLTEAGVSVVNVGNTAFLHYSRIFLRKEKEYQMDIPVAIITDVDIRAYQESEVNNGAGKKVHQYTKQDSQEVLNKSNEKIDKLKKSFDVSGVKVFVAPQWTLEYSIFQSKSLAKEFQSAFKKTHPDADENNLEQELAKKLINKGLEKTKIAYDLAQLIEDDIKSVTPEINLDENDKAIQYLMEAIKHACKN